MPRPGYLTLVILAVIVALVVLAVMTARASWMSPQPVSIVGLLATPERFAGARVQVIGYADLADGEAALYLSKDAQKAADTKSSIGLALTLDEQVNARSLLNGRYVFVEGTFDLFAPSGAAATERSGYLRNVTMTAR